MDYRSVSIEKDPHKYGIPSQKKFPMPDAAHVRSAIRFFNYVDPAHEKELARAILKRMKEYGLTFNDFTVGKENRFSKYIPQSGELVHHGIKGQRWGIRRFQNPDGTLTKAGEKHYNKISKDASDLGETHAKLERMTRELNKGVRPGDKILVTSDTKAEYKKLVNDYIKKSSMMTKKYGDLVSYSVSMDDGYDYIRTLVQADRLNGAVEYYTLIGKTEK